LDAAIERVGPLHFTVVGGGARLQELKYRAAALRNLLVRYLDKLPLSAVGNFLQENADVVFAMGTSALEGASRGIPTVLLDYSYRRITGLYRFRYLFEAPRYSGGRQIREEDLEDASSLEDMLLSLKRDYPRVAKDCYTAWQRSYSPSVVVQRFEEGVHHARATMGEMARRGFFRPDPLSLILKKFGRAIRPQAERIDGFGRS
jgi:hypothetical protein